jgi:hypothetical protein
MRVMVIERFKDVAAIGQRFRRHGRMMPDGLRYEASWIEPGGARCFQIMEAERRALLDEWMARWRDLMDFEVVEVQTSAEFWAARQDPDARAT